jgi:crossover junction endodeoxyribonuclease RuvC
VLGIDTSLRATGVGIVDMNGGRMRGVAFDVLRNPPRLPLSACLLNLRRGLAAVIDEFRPEAAAIESVFFARHARAALLLGHARGVAIATCAAAGLPVHEYEPRRVKQAVTGHGAAAKRQVQHMVAAQLSLAAPPPEDAADALALAICHLHDRLRPCRTAAPAL